MATGTPRAAFLAGLLATIPVHAPQAAGEPPAAIGEQAGEEAAAEATRSTRLAPSPQAPADVRPYREVHAFIVGIDDYADDRLDLEYAVDDARGVEAVLRERYALDSVTVLQDDEATRSGILRALARYRDLDPQDALFIFWAGHGQSEDVGDGEALGYLVPHDGSMDPDEMLVANISMNQLRDVVGKRIPAKHKLLVVDACYGGIMATRDAQLPRLDAAYLQAATTEPTFQVLTAGRADQPVLDGGPGGHSVFTGRFIEALSQVDDWSTAKAIYGQVEPRVRQDAFDRGEHLQTPVFGTLLGIGDFVFVPQVERAPDPRLLQAGDLRSRLRAVAASPPEGCEVPGGADGLARIQEQFQASVASLETALADSDEPAADAEHAWLLGLDALLAGAGCGP